MSSRPPWVLQYVTLALAGDHRAIPLGDAHLLTPEDTLMALECACQVCGIDADEMSELIEAWIKRHTH